MTQIHRIPGHILWPLVHAATAHKLAPTLVIAVASVDSEIAQMGDMGAPESRRPLAIHGASTNHPIPKMALAARHGYVDLACALLNQSLGDEDTIIDGLTCYFEKSGPWKIPCDGTRAYWVSMVLRWEKLISPETVTWAEDSYRWPLEVMS